MKILFFFLILFAMAWPVSNYSADQPLVLLYSNRPPYMSPQEDGKVVGLVATPADIAFTKAGIPVIWRVASIAGQNAAIQTNTDRVCLLGKYKTPERAEQAKFSLAISQDSAMVALVKKTSAATKLSTSSVTQILNNPNFYILIKKGIVYGDFLQEQFATMKAHRVEASDDYWILFKLISIGRADAIFAPEDEIKYYIKTGSVDLNSLEVLHFKEMPPGEKRHLMCSKAVEDSLISRFNDALQAKAKK